MTHRPNDAHQVANHAVLRVDGRTVEVVASGDSSSPRSQPTARLVEAGQMRNMVEAFRWILPGQLAGSGMPGLSNSLQSDIEYLRSVGIRRVVSLTESRIAADPEGEPSFHHFPIDDMGIPTLREASEICAFVLASIERQEPVLVHCKAGLGRTGTMLACCLISMGSHPERALERLRRLCQHYVQNEIQEGFLERYGEIVRASKTTASPTATTPIDEAMNALIPALDEVSNGVTLADARVNEVPLIYVNKAFERITGYSADEVLGRNCRLLQGPETDPAGLARLRSAIKEGKSCHLCLRNYRKDGSMFLNELKLLPVGGESGHPAYFIGIQNDVTALLVARAYQRQQRSVKEVTDLLSVEHLGASFEVRVPSPPLLKDDVAVLVTDLRGQIRYADGTAGDLLGVSPADLPATNIFEHLDADWLTETLRTGTPNEQDWLPARLHGAIPLQGAKVRLHRIQLEADASPLFFLLLRKADLAEGLAAP